VRYTAAECRRIEAAHAVYVEAERAWQDLKRQQFYQERDYDSPRDTGMRESVSANLGGAGLVQTRSSSADRLELGGGRTLDFSKMRQESLGAGAGPGGPGQRLVRVKVLREEPTEADRVSAQDLRTRRGIIGELVCSEAVYLTTLQTLHTKCFVPLQRAAASSATAVSDAACALCTAFTALYQLHVRFATKLGVSAADGSGAGAEAEAEAEAEAPQPLRVSVGTAAAAAAGASIAEEAFIEALRECIVEGVSALYAPYLVHFGSAMEEILAACPALRPTAAHIDSLLPEPMQRLHRYRTFLGALLQNAGDGSLPGSAAAAYGEIAQACQAVLVEVAKQPRMGDFQQMRIPIASSNRGDVAVPNTVVWLHDDAAWGHVSPEVSRLAQVHGIATKQFAFTRVSPVDAVSSSAAAAAAAAAAVPLAEAASALEAYVAAERDSVLCVVVLSFAREVPQGSEGEADPATALQERQLLRLVQRLGSESESSSRSSSEGKAAAAAAAAAAAEPVQVVQQLLSPSLKMDSAAVAAVTNRVLSLVHMALDHRVLTLLHRGKHELESVYELQAAGLGGKWGKPRRLPAFCRADGGAADRPEGRTLPFERGGVWVWLGEWKISAGGRSCDADGWQYAALAAGVRMLPATGWGPTPQGGGLSGTAVRRRLHWCFRQRLPTSGGYRDMVQTVDWASVRVLEAAKRKLALLTAGSGGGGGGGSDPSPARAINTGSTSRRARSSGPPPAMTSMAVVDLQTQAHEVVRAALAGSEEGGADPGDDDAAPPAPPAAAAAASQAPVEIATWLGERLAQGDTATQYKVLLILDGLLDAAPAATSSAAAADGGGDAPSCGFRSVLRLRTAAALRACATEKHVAGGRLARLAAECERRFGGTVTLPARTHAQEADLLRVHRLLLQLENDPLSWSLSAREQAFLWEVRCAPMLCASPRMLSKVLLAAPDWDDGAVVAEARRLLEVWAPLSAAEAIQLLDPRFWQCALAPVTAGGAPKRCSVGPAEAFRPFRDHAVRCLEGSLLADEQLGSYLLQLSLVVAHDHEDEAGGGGLGSSLVRWLLRRAVAAPFTLGQRMYCACAGCRLPAAGCCPSADTHHTCVHAWAHAHGCLLLQYLPWQRVAIQPLAASTCLSVSLSA
jgi:hypothetical protein